MRSLDKALDFIRQLAQTIGQTTASLWPKIVLYRRIEAMVNVVFEPLICVTALLLFVRAMKRRRDADWSKDPPLSVTVTLATSGVIFLIAFVAMVADFPSQLATLIAPEGAIVQSFLSFLSGKK